MQLNEKRFRIGLTVVVTLTSLLALPWAWPTLQQGNFTEDWAQTTALFFVALGLAMPAFLFVGRRLLPALLFVWWIPQLIQVSMLQPDQASGQFQSESMYDMLLLLRFSLTTGWDLAGGDVLRMHLNLLALTGVVGSCLLLEALHTSGQATGPAAGPEG